MSAFSNERVIATRKDLLTEDIVEYRETEGAPREERGEEWPLLEQGPACRASRITKRFNHVGKSVCTAALEQKIAAQIENLALVPPQLFRVRRFEGLGLRV